MMMYFYIKSIPYMKSKLTFLFLTVLLISCNNKNSLSFEPLSVQTEACENCTSVQIDIPKATGKTKLSATINSALEGEIIALLNFDEENNAKNLEEAKDAFLNDHEVLSNKFLEESIPWEASVEGSISFENDELITIKLASYIFTGGAHGYGTNRFLNFDKLKGIELYQENLFNNLKDFTLFAESQFRQQENIPVNNSINSTGFMFENELFYLPSNIGYTENGLLLFYEPYEIASFADGPITLTIPYKEANLFLKYPKKP